MLLFVNFGLDERNHGAGGEPAMGLCRGCSTSVHHGFCGAWRAGNRSDLDAAHVPQAWQRGRSRGIWRGWPLLLGAATIVAADLGAYQRLPEIAVARGLCCSAILVGRASFSIAAVFDPERRSRGSRRTLRSEPAIWAAWACRLYCRLAHWRVDGGRRGLGDWQDGTGAPLGLSGHRDAWASRKSCVAVLKNEDWLARGVKNVVYGMPKPGAPTIRLSCRKDHGLSWSVFTSMGLGPGHGLHPLRTNLFMRVLFARSF